MFDWANKAIFDDKPKMKSVPYVLDKNLFITSGNNSDREYSYEFKLFSTNE